MEKFNKPKPSPNVSQSLLEKKTKANTNFGNFKVSFQYFDSAPKHSSAFADWEKYGLLSHTLNVLKGYCCSPLRQQIDGKKFTRYGDFPPPNKTKFEYPSHVPEDAEWGRIHINGRSVIIGHIIDDTFYIVFFDKFHAFWLTKRVIEN